MGHFCLSIIEKAIQNEKNNFIEKKAFREVNVKSLPKGANLISSHCFFQVKTDGESGKLKLKCRLVPHGNRDREKDKIRKDSATAQFPVIRSLLSAATIPNLRLRDAIVPSRYDLHLRRISASGQAQPRCVCSRSRRMDLVQIRCLEVSCTAYGLAESGRLWRLTVEDWMKENDVLPVKGVPQMFQKKHSNGTISLLMAKVVDDFLIAGLPNDIQQFHHQIGKRFKVGRFICDKDLIFNRLHISQADKGFITISMQKYIDTIQPIPLDRARRKNQEEKCTLGELKMLQALAGELNWLGHGISRLQPICQAFSNNGRETFR